MFHRLDQPAYHDTVHTCIIPGTNILSRHEQEKKRQEEQAELCKEEKSAVCDRTLQNEWKEETEASLY
jgi:hypothetical protein